MFNIVLAVIGAALLPARPGLPDTRGGAGGAAARTLSNLDRTTISHNFDDGELGPFYQCTTRSPNTVSVEDGRLKTYWTETGFDGSRMTRGAEFCDAVREEDRDQEFRTFKEGWMGFKMNIEPGHNTESSSALAQVFQFDDSEDFFTWAGLLELEKGDLLVVHRDRSRSTRGVVMENAPFGVDLNIVIGFVASQKEKGMFKIWVDGELMYSAEGIDFGFGQWEADDTMNRDNTYITLKLGMYNHDDETYTRGEERTVCYDNVTWYVGSDGYSVVDPMGASGSRENPSTNPAQPVQEEQEDEEEELEEEEETEAETPEPEVAVEATSEAPEPEEPVIVAVKEEAKAPEPEVTEEAAGEEQGTTGPSRLARWMSFFKSNVA